MRLFLAFFGLMRLIPDMCSTVISSFDGAQACASCAPGLPYFLQFLCRIALSRVPEHCQQGGPTWVVSVVGI